jgi:hypothetical protein
MRVRVESSMRSLTWCVVGAAAALACACGSTATPAAHRSVVVGTQDAGQTVTVHVGDSVVVVLQDDFPVPGSALVWNATSLDTTVLEPGSSTRSPREKSGPGAHDTYTATFHAMGAGQSVLDVHGTTSCEAMAKTNCPDRDFTVTVVVTN